MIDLGPGTDRITLGPGVNQVTLANVEVVTGSAASDMVTLAGATGQVSVSLGAGRDLLVLGDGGLRVTASGVEIIRGGAGADHVLLVSGSPAAWIEGGGGNDTLTGAEGADTIFGGTGADRLTGGAGADLFLYTAVSHSSAASPDTIIGFNPAEGDIIALVGLMDGGAFRWRGPLAFTAQGEAEGRFDETTRILRIDLDGDGTAEMAWSLPGFSPPAGGAPWLVWA